MQFKTVVRTLWLSTLVAIVVFGVAVDVFQGLLPSDPPAPTSVTTTTRQLRTALTVIAVGNVSTAILTALFALVFIKGYKLFQPFMGGDSFIAVQAVAITALASSLIILLGYGCTHGGAGTKHHLAEHEQHKTRSGQHGFHGESKSSSANPLASSVLGEALTRTLIFFSPADDGGGLLGAAERSCVDLVHIVPWEGQGARYGIVTAATVVGALGNVLLMFSLRVFDRRAPMLGRKVLISLLFLRSPTREMLLVSAATILNGLLCIIATVRPHDSIFTTIVSMTFLPIHLVCGLIVHVVIGWMHTPGYRLFSPFSGGAKFIVANFIGWCLFGTTILGALLIAAAPSSSTTSSGTTAKKPFPFRLLYLGMMHLVSILLLLVITRVKHNSVALAVEELKKKQKKQSESERDHGGVETVQTREHLQELYGDSSVSLLGRHGCFLFTSVSAFHTVFVFVVASLLLDEVQDAYPTASYFRAIGSDAGWRLCIAVTVGFLSILPVCSHLIGPLVAGNKYQLWQPFKGPRLFIVLQAVSWSLYGTAALCAILMFSAPTNSDEQGMWSIAAAVGFGLAQFTIHASIKTFIVPSSSNGSGDIERHKTSPSTKTDNHGLTPLAEEDDENYFAQRTWSASSIGAHSDASRGHNDDDLPDEIEAIFNSPAPSFVKKKQRHPSNGSSLSSSFASVRKALDLHDVGDDDNTPSPTSHSPASPSTGGGGAALVGGPLNGESVTCMLLLLWSVMLRLVCDRLSWDEVTWWRDKILLVSIILWVPTPFLAHASRRKEGVALVRPFGGCGEHVALQALGWTLTPTVFLAMLFPLTVHHSSSTIGVFTPNILQSQQLRFVHTITGVVAAIAPAVLALSVHLEVAHLKKKRKRQEQLLVKLEKLMQPAATFAPRQASNTSSSAEKYDDLVALLHREGVLDALPAPPPTKSGLHNPLQQPQPRSNAAAVQASHSAVTLVVVMLAGACLFCFVVSSAIADTIPVIAKLISCGGYFVACLAVGGLHFAYGPWYHQIAHPGSPTSNTPLFTPNLVMRRASSSILSNGDSPDGSRKNQKGGKRRQITAPPPLQPISRYRRWMPFSGPTVFVWLQASAWMAFGTATFTMTLTLLDFVPTKSLFNVHLITGFTMAASPILIFLSIVALGWSSSNASSPEDDEKSFIALHAEGCLSISILVGSLGLGYVAELIVDHTADRTVPLVVSSLAVVVALPFTAVALKKSAGGVLFLGSTMTQPGSSGGGGDEDQDGEEPVSFEMLDDTPLDATPDFGASKRRTKAKRGGMTPATPATLLKRKQFSGPLPGSPASPAGSPTLPASTYRAARMHLETIAALFATPAVKNILIGFAVMTPFLLLWVSYHVILRFHQAAVDAGITSTSVVSESAAMDSRAAQRYFVSGISAFLLLTLIIKTSEKYLPAWVLDLRYVTSTYVLYQIPTVVVGGAFLPAAIWPRFGTINIAVVFSFYSFLPKYSLRQLVHLADIAVAGFWFIRCCSSGYLAYAFSSASSPEAFVRIMIERVGGTAAASVVASTGVWDSLWTFVSQTLAFMLYGSSYTITTSTATAAMPNLVADLKFGWFLIDLVGMLFPIVYFKTYHKAPEFTGRYFSEAFSRFMIYWVFNDSEKFFNFKIINFSKKRFLEKPDSPHILGFHPHGLFPATAQWATHLPAWHRKIGRGTSAFTHAASIIFNVPGLRDFAMRLGMRIVTKAAIEHTLDQGHAAMIVPGGQAELLVSRFSMTELRLVTYHIGFLRLAMAKQVPAVPVFCFGEHNVQDNIHLPTIQKWFLGKIGFGAPLIPMGAFYLPLPYRTPLTLVVGEPLVPPPLSSHSSSTKAAEEDEKHLQAFAKKYFDHLVWLIEKYKVEAGYPSLRIKLVGRGEL